MNFKTKTRNFNINKNKLSYNLKKISKVSDMSYKLSKSKINDYLQCPRKFRYSYINKIETEENEYFKIGGDVHQIAEDFIKLWQKDDSIDFLDTLYELESKYDDDYKDHCIHLADFFKEKLTCEGYEVFSTEEYLFSEKYNFSGLADIVLEKDGKLTVIDYKTGKSKSARDYVTELCYYKMLVEDAYPDKTVEYAAIYFTKDGKYSELKFIEEDYSAVNCSVTEYNNKIELIEKVREKIEAGEFSPKRQYLCQYCDFKTHCDEEGFIS